MTKSMKNQRSSKFLFTVTALLAAGLAFASTARAQNERETSLAVPRARGANLFLTVGPTYMNAKSVDANSGTDGVDLYGALVGFGWRIDHWNKIQIEVGVLAGSESHTYYYSGGYYSSVSSLNLDYVVVPELFTYSVCIPLARSRRCELRISPSIGGAYVFTDYEYSSSSYWRTATDSDIALAAGIGVGLTIHVSKLVFLDIGYRYLRVGKTEYNWGRLDALNTHSLAFLVGWKL
jgi:opacity protein-like surface antigen